MYSADHPNLQPNHLLCSRDKICYLKGPEMYRRPQIISTGLTPQGLNRYVSILAGLKWKKWDVLSSFATLFLITNSYIELWVFACNKQLLDISATSYRIKGVQGTQLKFHCILLRKWNYSIAVQSCSPGFRLKMCHCHMACETIFFLSTMRVILDVESGITMYFRYKFDLWFILFQWLYNMFKFALVWIFSHRLKKKKTNKTPVVSHFNKISIW